MDVDSSPETSPEPVPYETRPLKTLDELMAWSSETTDPPRPRLLRKGLRKSSHLGDVMYIHDMKGGYLDDRFVEGNDNLEAFRFYHWHLIDFFVYFSHHFVTIPPLSWIEVAHLNGVPVLGTFITEWEEGQALLHDILTSNRHIMVADQLIEIARTLCFEGWLINIEHELNKDLIPKFTEFLKRLADSDLLIVWYDAVTSEGELRWQNELNDKNWPFFDVLSQGGNRRGRILLNYTWKVDNLDRSRTYAIDHNFLPCIVFAGVDVFGRGCIGGGGFGCDEAVKIIAARPSLSVGLFAPGWVSERLPVGQDFHAFNQKFWNNLDELLGGPRMIVGNLSTSFSLGQGPEWFYKGQRLAPEEMGAVNDMRRQMIMPHFYPKETDPYRLLIDNSMAFNGSNCLRVVVEGSEPVEVPLFATWKENSVLKRFSVIVRWPKGGPGAKERFLGLLVKCRNREVDQEECERELERRLNADTSPADDLYRVSVVGLTDNDIPSCEQQDTEMILSELRDHCIQHYRMDEMCLIPGTQIAKMELSQDNADNMEGNWINYVMRGFGRPGELDCSQTFVCEVGLLMWDRRPHVTQGGERAPMTLLVGGAGIEWHERPVVRMPQPGFPRLDDSDSDSEAEAENVRK